MLYLLDQDILSIRWNIYCENLHLKIKNFEKKSKTKTLRVRTRFTLFFVYKLFTHEGFHCERPTTQLCLLYCIITRACLFCNELFVFVWLSFSERIYINECHQLVANERNEWREKSQTHFIFTSPQNVMRTKSWCWLYCIYTNLAN